MKLFLDISEYLADNGINLPIGLFWVILFFTIVYICVVFYKKSIKPIIEDIKKIDDKINRIDEIDDIKNIQNKSISKSIEYDKKFEDELKIINEKIESISKQVLNMQIYNMRFEILDFGNGIMNGKNYDKEAYNHILDIYNNYELILKEHNMTNGRVTTNMEIIEESYKKKFSVPMQQ